MNYIKNFKNNFNESSLLIKILFIFLFIFIILMLYCLIKKKDLISTQLSKQISAENQSNESAELTMYYVNWCGYCKKSKPEFEKLMKYDGQIIYDNLVSINMIDCDKNKELAEQENITSYPTIKLKHNNNMYVYNGERTESALMDFLKEKLD